RAGTLSVAILPSSIASIEALYMLHPGRRTGRPSSLAVRTQRAASGLLQAGKRSRPIAATPNPSKHSPGRLIAPMLLQGAMIAPFRSGHSRGDRLPAILATKPGCVPSPGRRATTGSPPPPIKRYIYGNHSDLAGYDAPRET